MDEHAATEPALSPREAPRDHYKTGTALRAIGTTLAAVPDGSDAATTQTLTNAIKAALVQAFGDDNA